MRVSDNKQSRVDSQEDLESCQIKDRTTSREFSPQHSAQSFDRESLLLGGSGKGDNDDENGYSGRGKGVEPVNEEGPTNFCVGDVRKRLTQHSSAPRKMFQRDPNDPSGEKRGREMNTACICSTIISYFHSLCDEGAVGGESSKNTIQFSVWTHSQLEYPLYMIV
jgi:hypothetical protein